MSKLSSVRWSGIVTIIVVFATATWDPARVLPDTANRQKLPDGIYAVLDTSAAADSLPSTGRHQRIVKYRRDVQWGNTDPSMTFLLIRTRPDVPLYLAADPLVVRGPGGDERIRVRLVGSSAGRLSRLTKRNLGRKLAVVIGGQVVFLPTIRTPIEHGEFELSFCARGVATILATKLRGRVGTSPKD